jgi:hypothetical protein
MFVPSAVVVLIVPFESLHTALTQVNPVAPVFFIVVFGEAITTVVCSHAVALSVMAAIIKGFTYAGFVTCVTSVVPSGAMHLLLPPVFHELPEGAWTRSFAV